MITTKPARILVPTDFSETAAHAMRHASDLALRSGARLIVIYVDSFLPPIDVTATIGGWDDSLFRQLRDRAEGQLQREAAANIDALVPCETIVRVARPVEGIVAQARESEAELIVMGTHGRSGVRRLILGSVTEAVMRKAETPVLAVPPETERGQSIHTVVCPAVYNEQCRDALLFAAALAPADAKFVVIRATPADDVIDTADDLADLRAWLPPSLAPRCELKMFGSGHVAEQIEAYADSVHADLLVAAEPGGRSAADVLYGTFAARLVQRGHCPVLTVNRPAAMRALREADRDRGHLAVFANH